MDEFLSENTLSDSINQSDSDEEIDIVKCAAKVKVKSEVVHESSLEVLPVDSEEDRLRFMFIEKKCADIGIELRNEDVGNGYAYRLVLPFIVIKISHLMSCDRYWWSKILLV